LLYLNVPDRRTINCDRKKNKLRLDKVKTAFSRLAWDLSTRCIMPMHHSNSNSYTTSSDCHAAMPGHTSREATDDLKLYKAQSHTAIGLCHHWRLKGGHCCIAAFVATTWASGGRSDNDEWVGRVTGGGGCLGSARAFLRRSDS
jgi:hypothetical protein